MAGRNTILSGAAALLVATAGCGVFDSDGASSDIARYFPLAEGNTWTYQLTGWPQDTWIRRVNGVQDGWRVVRESWVTDEIGSNTSETQYRIADETLTERHFTNSVDRPVLREPLRVGASWTYESRAAWVAMLEPVLIRSVVTAVDAAIKTSAGRFTNVLVIETQRVTENGEPYPGSSRDGASYAPGVGLVRSVVRDGESEYVQELVAYDVR